MSQEINRRIKDSYLRVFKRHPNKRGPFVFNEDDLERDINKILERRRKNEHTIYQT